MAQDALVKKVKKVNDDLKDAIGMSNAASRITAFKKYVASRTKPDVKITVAGQELPLLPFEKWYDEMYAKVVTLIGEIETKAKEEATKAETTLDDRITE